VVVEIQILPARPILAVAVVVVELVTAAAPQVVVE
jgi:hypothetical protein